MQFQPSHLSPPSKDSALGDFGPLQSVVVKDATGDAFRVYADGMVVRESSGQTWPPEKSCALIRNLVGPELGTNRAKVEQITGPELVAKCLSGSGGSGSGSGSGSAVRTPGSGGTTARTPDTILDGRISKYSGTLPSSESSWFWPVVILGGLTTLVAAGGAVYYFTQTDDGRKSGKQMAAAAKPTAQRLLTSGSEQAERTTRLLSDKASELSGKAKERYLKLTALAAGGATESERSTANKLAQNMLARKATKNPSPASDAQIDAWLSEHWPG